MSFITSSDGGATWSKASVVSNEDTVFDRDPNTALHTELSDREFQVFLRLAKGATVSDIGVALSLWIFVTPVVYPLERVPPTLRPLILLNPMTPVVSSFQDLLLNGRLPAAGPLLGAAAIALATLVLGYLAFKWLEPLFAETV